MIELGAGWLGLPLEEMEPCCLASDPRCRVPGWDWGRGNQLGTDILRNDALFRAQSDPILKVNRTSKINI